jgi:hypothetical protein
MINNAKLVSERRERYPVLGRLVKDLAVVDLLVMIADSISIPVPHSFYADPA